MSFPLLMVILVFVSGALALLDMLLLAPRRRVARAAYEASVTTTDPAVLARLEQVPVPVEYGKSLFPVLAFVLVLRSFLVEPFQIPSGSMRPTLEVGDFILVNKFAYGIRLPVIDTKIIEVGQPKRGDVMVFRYPVDPDVNYIKRVVGLPGDHVRYTEDKRLYVNGQLVTETALGDEAGSLGTARLFREQLGEAEHLVRKEVRRPSMLGDREWVVPQGYYFMMGDNRDNSNDSRFWQDSKVPAELQGMVPDRNIVGKAFAVWVSWPAPKLQNLPSLSRIGLIH